MIRKACVPQIKQSIQDRVKSEIEAHGLWSTSTVRTDTRIPPEGERPRKAARGSSTENGDERSKPDDETLCRDFMNKGTCWRGNTCRFSHDWAHAPSGKGSGKGKGKASKGKAKREKGKGKGK